VPGHLMTQTAGLVRGVEPARGLQASALVTRVRKASPWKLGVMALTAQSRLPLMCSFWPFGGACRARQSPALTREDLPHPEAPETTNTPTAGLMSYSRLRTSASRAQPG